MLIASIVFSTTLILLVTTYSPIPVENDRDNVMCVESVTVANKGAKKSDELKVFALESPTIAEKSTAQALTTTETETSRSETETEKATEQASKDETTTRAVTTEPKMTTLAKVETTKTSTTKVETTKTSTTKVETTKTSTTKVETTKITNKNEAEGNYIIVDGVKYKAQPNTKITYYCPCYQCSEGFGRSTSSGATATAGRTVAMPSNVPYGTKIYYNGHVYVCEDRGGAITPGHIDIFCDTHSQCYQYADSGTYQTIYIEVK